MERQPRAAKTFEIDLSVPVDRNRFKAEQSNEASCFGKMWDLGNKLCSVCADKDTCGILYRDVVDAKAKVLEKAVGAKYLDSADFENVTNKKLLSFIVSGTTTLEGLITEIMRLANTSDSVAAQNWLKRWHADNKLITTKNKIVWVN